MENTYALWAKGTSGSQHVWGKIELDQKGDIEVILLKHEKYPFLNKIGKLLKINHLDQQIRILGNLRHFDILYAPYSSANTRLLVLLKWIGLFRKPIVVTIHQRIFSSKNSKISRIFAKQFLLQYDASIFLSEPLMKKTLEEFEFSDEIIDKKFFTAQWGPEIEFYKKFNRSVPFNECNYFISAGHTDRDYETLIEAFRGINYQLKIYCTPRSLPKNVNIPSNVSICSEFTPYIELLEHYRKSRAILIPLKYPASKEGCQGMTSIQDVVAMGMPVVMTRNPLLNLDVEKEGFGILVDKGDVEGWRRAVNALIEDENILKKMGKNADITFKEKFNSTLYAQTLEKVLRNVYNKNNAN